MFLRISVVPPSIEFARARRKRYVHGSSSSIARGPAAQLVDDVWTYRFLRARANSIEGGTTEILKNIIAERVLGLPKLR